MISWFQLALFWSAYIAVILAVTRANTEEIVAAAETCTRHPFADLKDSRSWR
jgi:hypothetical protein